MEHQCRRSNLGEEGAHVHSADGIIVRLDRLGRDGLAEESGEAPGRRALRPAKASVCSGFREG